MEYWKTLSQNWTIRYFFNFSKSYWNLQKNCLFVLISVDKHPPRPHKTHYPSTEYKSEKPNRHQIKNMSFGYCKPPVSLSLLIALFFLAIYYPCCYPVTNVPDLTASYAFLASFWTRFRFETPKSHPDFQNPDLFLHALPKFIQTL